MWFSKKKRRGDILISVIIAAAVGAVISISTVKMNLASINAATATKKITQAEQYAKAQAGLIRATKYDELAAVSKTAVGTDSDFSYEILKGEETAYNADVNQRIMTVNVYNGSDSVPLFTLNVPRLTKEENAGESYIVESWHEGTEWYRVWSDGFIEQGGSLSAIYAVVYSKTINLTGNLAISRKNVVPLQPTKLFLCTLFRIFIDVDERTGLHHQCRSHHNRLGSEIGAQ